MMINDKSTLTKEVQSLILRITESEDFASKFEADFIQGDGDKFTLSDKNGKILIEATTPIAACAGFGYYLKKYCKCYFGPITKNITILKSLPRIGEKIIRTSKFRYRYFMNYCTFSYTLLFSGWSDYERLIDWLLVSGVNLVLNPVAHEAVWFDVLCELGYTKDEIDKFLCGPAYLPWQWMGNMTEFGGDLPLSWYKKQTALSNKINEKLLKFGAKPVLPGFYGMVPGDFGEKFKESNPIDQGGWCGFDRPSLIVDDDLMFKKVSDIFYKKTKERFGEGMYFSGDPFHEGGKTKGIELERYGENLISNMKEFFPDGKWLFQGWQDNPRREMLAKIDKNDAFILSLSSDTHYRPDDNFGGFPWVYCTTTNFGGARKMYGNINGMLYEPLISHMDGDEHAPIGIGMTMEGIEVDEILYDVFSYVAFAEEKPDRNTFLKEFLESRYGFASKEAMEAYNLLCDNIYTLSGTNLFGTKESALCARPALDVKNVSTWGNKEEIPYGDDVLPRVVSLLMSDYERLKDNEAYRLDITDILRQAAADKGWQYIKRISADFKNKNRGAFNKDSMEFLQLFDLQEALLATNKHCLLGIWLKKAEDYAENEADRAMFLFNAKNLITLWAPPERAAELRDYAHREWSGMVGEFYKKRWSAFISLLNLYMDCPEKMPQIDWKEFEFVFVLEDKKYETQEQGNLENCANDMLKFLKK